MLFSTAASLFSAVYSSAIELYCGCYRVATRVLSKMVQVRVIMHNRKEAAAMVTKVILRIQPMRRTARLLGFSPGETVAREVKSSPLVVKGAEVVFQKKKSEKGSFCDSGEASSTLSDAVLKQDKSRILMARRVQYEGWIQTRNWRRLRREEPEEAGAESQAEPTAFVIGCEEDVWMEPVSSSLGNISMDESVKKEETSVVLGEGVPECEETCLRMDSRSCMEMEGSQCSGGEGILEEEPSAAAAARDVDDGDRSVANPSNNLMILAVPFFQSFTIFVLGFSGTSGGFNDFASNYMPEFLAFEKTGHSLSPKDKVCAVESDRNGLEKFAWDSNFESGFWQIMVRNSGGIGVGRFRWTADMIKGMVVLSWLGTCKSEELTVVEHNLLSVAYKKIIGARRTSWRIISSIDKKEESRGNAVHVVTSSSPRLQAHPVLHLRRLQKSLLFSSLSKDNGNWNPHALGNGERNGVDTIE
ncbi:hypothetical protein RHSIM_Rhsim12G0049600 [Rhododendron simsii]|uniref:14-3-3 domain-containing protein n=1 Tax=Rhododendron simsii TaxID=118357 RepID=A0A834L784_RHOSS|nr:hypothetical protein RHSIM_Rhsim12G0049600 [Rhododendron simsii]